MTYTLNQTFPGEYVKLRDDFNAAISQPREAMGVVMTNFSAIRSGSGEISQAADDLSRRTEQQAASLEETAAALDEITATVNRTASGARQASEAVRAAKGDAETSGVVVRDAITAMGAIETSAHQINQTIGVIDEIAFQTNLLALKWLARDERQFVNAPDYVGSDRRVRHFGPPLGEKGRREGDLSTHVGEATETNMDQADIDSLIKPRRVAL